MSSDLRTVLSCQILGKNLIGTYHRAARESDSAMSDVGVLLINPGPAPRSGNADLYVRLAERLASKSIHVFRFDLIGLGDSSGEIPPTLQEYWLGVLNGRNDEATLELGRELKKRYQISRLIVGGLCGAVVPTLRLFEEAPEEFAGGILLEPDFQMVDGWPPSSSTGDSAAGPGANGSPTRRDSWGRRLKDGLRREGRINWAVRPMRRLLSRLRWMRSGALPGDTNLHLVRSWNAAHLHGAPTLVVVAERLASDLYVSRILENHMRQAPRTITQVRIPNTNHILTGGDGRAATVTAVERWVLETFPPNQMPASTTARQGAVPPERVGAGHASRR